MSLACEIRRTKTPIAPPLSRALCILIAATLPLWTSCAAFKRESPEKTEEKETDKAPRLIGRIATIPPGKQFVLIQSYGTWNIEPGTILTTRGPESRTANLRVTGESLGQFAAADLQSGTLELGDAVYSRHKPKPPPSPQAPETPTQALESEPSPDLENVQKNN
jgi:hypothetical protein